MCCLFWTFKDTVLSQCSETILKQYVSYFFMFNEENYICQFPSVSRSVVLTFCVLHLVHNSSERKLAGEKVLYFPVCSVKMTTLNFQCELQDAQNYVKMFVLLHIFKVYEYFV